MDTNTLDSADTADTVDASTEASTAAGMASHDANGATATPATSSDAGSQATQAESAGNGSLTTDPKTQASTTGATPPQLPPEAIEWKKRYDGQTRSYTQERQARQQMEQRYAQLEAKMQAFEHASKQQQDKNLPSWDKRNPQAGKFNAIRDNWNRMKTAYNRAQSPEEKEAIKSTISRAFSPEEHQQIADFEQHKDGFINEMAADPKGTIRETAREIFREEMRAQQIEQRANQDVGQWFQQNEQLIANPEDAQYMEHLLQNGSGWQAARDAVSLRARVRELESQIGGAQHAITRAEAKESLLKGNASITRDQAVSKPVDIYAEVMKKAKAENWPPGDPRVMAETVRLERLHAKHR